MSGEEALLTVLHQSLEGDSDTSPDAQLAVTDPTLLEYRASSGEESKETFKIAEDLGDRLQVLALSADETTTALGGLASDTVPSTGPEEAGGTTASQLPSSGRPTEAEGTDVRAAAAVAMEAEMAVLQWHLAVVASAARENQLSTAGGGSAAPKQQGRVLENVLERLMQELELPRTLATFRQEW